MSFWIVIISSTLHNVCKEEDAVEPRMGCFLLYFECKDKLTEKLPCAWLILRYF